MTLSACSRIKFTRALLIGLVIGLLSSCTYINDRLTLLEGNFFFSGGQEKEAIAAYLKVAASKELVPYGEFGLACVYLAMGELEASRNRLASIQDNVDDSSSNEKGLIYASYYNSGIARYQGGDFAGAAKEFRRALEIDGSQADAKRNLELSLRMFSRKSTNASSAAPLGKKEAGNEPKVLFDFIREKESDRWKSREWKAESTSTLDY